MEVRLCLRNLSYGHIGGNLRNKTNNLKQNNNNKIVYTTFFLNWFDWNLNDIS